MCQACGRPAEEVHHKIHLSPSNICDTSITLNPDNLISLCRDCHFQTHREDTLRKLRKESKYILNENGTYMDENGMMQKRAVHIVYGSPCAGKTTYVKEHMQDGDCVIDPDAIMAALQLKDARKVNNNLRWLVLDLRDDLIRRLADESRDFDCKHVWIIGGYPLRHERETLRDTLHADLIYISATQKECENRARNAYGDEQAAVEIVRDWWQRFEP